MSRCGRQVGSASSPTVSEAPLPSAGRRCDCYGSRLAIGVVAAIVLALVAIRGTRTAIVEQISNPNGEETADALLLDLVGDLRGFAMIIVSIAVVVGVGAFVAGRPALIDRFARRREATEMSDTDRWVARHADLVRGAGLVLAIGGLAFFGVTWWLVLIGAVVLAALLLYVGSVAHQAIDIDRSAASAIPPSRTDERSIAADGPPR
jgi:hypothetical protein